jgi:uncharacterized protein (TIGR02145 family)
MTTAQRNAIVNPATGLQIFNTTTNCINYWVGSNWFEVCGACTPQAVQPTSGTHAPNETQIVWNWNASAVANGYKWHTTNDYSMAIDLGNVTTYTQTGLTCNTSNTIYVWAYTSCGNSTALTLTQTTTGCPCGANFTDTRDNTVYSGVQIGLQCWLAKNLAYLPVVHDNSQFQTQGNNSQSGYGVYGYNGSNVATAKAQANYTTYGVLYNWFAAMNGSASSNVNPSGVQGICPTGWHLPSDAEWTQLKDYLVSNQGGKLKQTGTTHWTNPNSGATNETGFTALPGGKREINGTFSSIYNVALFWPSSQETGANAYVLDLPYFNGGLYNGAGSDKKFGYSIRCVRND